MPKRNAARPVKSVATPEAQRRAAAYLRMSTDGQRYSIGNQMKAIREYAERNQIELIKTYTDEGKSGLTIDARKALAELIRDIISGQNDFSEVLVYDVSRWGRFQDLDESAHYEFLCRRNGVRVTYCEDLFVNDGSPYSAVVKALKRAQAADESRIKSARVFATLSHLASAGLHPGGPAPYGFVRVAVSKNRQRTQALEPGTQRSIRADSVVLMRGNKSEIRVIRHIFDLYVNYDILAAEIARRLNASGIPSPTGGRWSHPSVTYIITNRLYTGVKLWNRASAKLKSKRQDNDPSKWIECRILTKGIISPELFEKAQRVRAIRRRRGRKSDEQLLAELKKAIRKHGPLPSTWMRSWCGLSSPTTYIKRFGSLRRVYELLELTRPQSQVQWDNGLVVRQARTQVLDAIRQSVERLGGVVEVFDMAHTFRIDGRLTAYLDLLQRRQDDSGRPYWRLRMPLGEKQDVYVVGLLRERALVPFRYYVIPRELTGTYSVVFREGPWLHGRRRRRVEEFRRPDLSAVIDDLRQHLASGVWRLGRSRPRIQSNRSATVA